MKKFFNVTVNGNIYEVEVEEVATGATVTPVATEKPVSIPQSTPKTTPATAAPKITNIAPGTNTVTAPMPGTILDIKVSEGILVKQGDVLLVLEAMKMENEILAPVDGVVVSVNIIKGASVNTGDVLITM